MVHFDRTFRTERGAKSLFFFIPTGTVIEVIVIVLGQMPPPLLFFQDRRKRVKREKFAEMVFYDSDPVPV